MRYALIDTATEQVLGIILWDGVMPYDPGEGRALREATPEDEVACSEQGVQGPL